MRGVKDPYFDIKVEIQKNKDDNNLMQSVIDVRKKEREFTKKGST